MVSPKTGGVPGGSENRLEDAEPDQQSGDEDDADDPANDFEHRENLPKF
jgi:hypothetical protein